MEGTGLRAGAVGAMPPFKNPVLARQGARKLGTCSTAARARRHSRTRLRRGDRHMITKAARGLQTLRAAPRSGRPARSARSHASAGGSRPRPARCLMAKRSGRAGDSPARAGTYARRNRCAQRDRKGEASCASRSRPRARRGRAGPDPRGRVRWAAFMKQRVQPRRRDRRGVTGAPRLGAHTHRMAYARAGAGIAGRRRRLVSPRLARARRSPSARRARAARTQRARRAINRQHSGYTAQGHAVYMLTKS